MVILASTAKGAYLELVKELPLVRIKSDEHLEYAQSFVDGLLQQELDTGGTEYLDVLSDLIADYEDEHHPIEKVTPSEMLRHLMTARGLNQKELGEATGLGKSGISQFLSKTNPRDISIKAAKTLAEYFEVDAGLFI